MLVQRIKCIEETDKRMETCAEYAPKKGNMRNKRVKYALKTKMRNKRVKYAFIDKPPLHMHNKIIPKR